MNDYCNGIAYAAGYFANDSEKPYLVVRNLDKWYVDMIALETGYAPYESKHNFIRDGRNQWTIKARNVHSLPECLNIVNKADFCRAYIELHGVLDMATAKNRNNTYFKKPRFRIYGKEYIVSYLNQILPAKEKKIQYIKNIVDGNYIGETCAIYYQSKKEIIRILSWLDGYPKNEKIWKGWEHVLAFS